MNKKILLIEELEAISKSIIFILQSNGFEVLSTGTTKAGLKILAEMQIDLIIADVDLEKSKADIFIKELANSNEYRLIPLIILADEEYKPSVKMLGGTEAWIKKPFSADKLLTSIRNISHL